MNLKLFGAIGWLICGSFSYRWPDLACTRVASQRTRPARRWWRKGKPVIPLEHYSFHTNFDVRTDGRQWILRCGSSYISSRVNAHILFFFGALLLAFGIVEVKMEQPLFFLYTSVPFLASALYFILKVRTGGEDTWIVLDRTTGNVCFWKRKAKKSLTVPFDQVKCYWLTKSLRGGVSHHLCLMPEVSLPNERNRHWEVMMGSTPMYEQAQYFWRVINDFMDASQPIPEVDGLIHQVRSMEKLGYSLEDITHGGKEVPIKEWEAVEKELRNDAKALEARLDRLREPDQFSADGLFSFYKQAPIYFKKHILRVMRSDFKAYYNFMQTRGMMAPGFSRHFTMEEYQSEITKLGNLLTELPDPNTFYG